jgi:hypothetical protein
MQCSICLDDLDTSGPTLACGHGRAPAPKVIVDPEAPVLRSNIRSTPRPVVKRTFAEGAQQKQNGKWSSRMFPGREFDDLDEYRAAKRQHKERRAAYSDQASAFGRDYRRMR